MKKILKYGVPLLIGIVLGVLGACGVYELTVSQGTMDWQAYIEEQVIPIISQVGATVLLLTVAAQPILKGVQSASSQFNQATKDVKETVNNGKSVAQSVSEQGQQTAELRGAFDDYRRESEERDLAQQKEIANLRKMLEIGFGNNEYLVKNGYARQIMAISSGKGNGGDTDGGEA